VKRCLLSKLRAASLASTRGVFSTQGFSISLDRVYCRAAEADALIQTIIQDPNNIRSDSGHVETTQNEEDSSCKLRT